MHGFHPGARRPGAQKLADGGPVQRAKQAGKSEDDTPIRNDGGGPVRGPGTGTSDDIETEVPAGSYIMPADSTAAVGTENLAGMGAPVPVNLSNGEYQLPPEQVHAIGVQALNDMKAATHSPVEQRQDDESTLFFANGGVVPDDETQRNPLAQTQGAAFGVYRREPTAGSRGGMMEPYVATGPSTFEPATVQQGSGRLNAETDPRSLTYNPSAAVPGVARPYAGVGEGWGAGARAAAAAPASTPAPVPSPAAPAPVTPAEGVGAAQVMPGVYRAGNSYSDSREGAVTGFMPRSAPSAQNEAAAQALSDRYAGEAALSRAAPAPAGQRQEGGVTVINAEPFGFTSPAERAQRKLLDATTTPYAGSPNGQLTANQVRTLAGLQETASREATTRYTSDQQRDTAQMREAGETQRAAASTAVAQGRLNLEGAAQGFQTRSAQRLERLQQQYETAKPAERSAIAQQIRDFQGKENPNRFTVVPGGQEWDQQAMAMRNVPSRVLNNQTGEFMQTPGAGAPQAARAVGSTSTVNGKTAVWDGSKWVPR